MLTAKRNDKKSIWVKYADAPGEKIYYRQEKGGAHTTYTETLVNAPLIDVLSVLSDVENYKKWVSIVTHSEILAEVSLLRKVACIRANLPKPLSAR